MSNKYDWPKISQRLNDAIRPSSSPIALKFIKTEEELKQIPNLKYWKEAGAGPCKLIGIVSYWKVTLAITSECSDRYCGQTHGLLDREKDWWNAGVHLNTYPTKWHGKQEDSAAHMEAMLPDLPSEGHIALVGSPLSSGDIAEPDAIVISSDPGAAFHILAALVEKDHRALDLIFRGESACADTWCRTYTSGKPGLSLGCRGDRCVGALGTSEVRFSISTEDLLTALDGVDRFKADGIEYPYYPDGIIDVKAL